MDGNATLAQPCDSFYAPALMKLRNAILALGAVLATSAGSALAVTSFTETFNSNASNWLNGDSNAPIYVPSGGIDDSGYISFIAPDFNSGSGGFGDPLKLMFRANAANDASGGAFVGNWLAGDIQTFSIAVRHNYSTPLNLYTRFAGTAGAGASLANVYSIEPNTWTTITISITDSNPPFTSYGSSNFDGVFSNVQNLQIGLYLPADTDFSGLTMDIDNVAIVVPEPHTYALGIVGLIACFVFTWRRRASAEV